MPVAEVQAPASHTQVITLDDGMVVLLSGRFEGFEALVSLRGALLSARPEGVDDVIVDAGEVTELSDDALAVLWAGLEWAEITGGRLSFSRMSAPVTDMLGELNLTGELPRLEVSRVGQPAQRRPRD
ncbi:MAG: STAS domain-containing protein [Mycobacteriales bacterium]